MIGFPIIKLIIDLGIFTSVVAQFYKKIMRSFLFIMEPITKLMHRFEPFVWTTKCEVAWEGMKIWYSEGSILVSPKWDLEFHVHTNALQLTMGVILAQFQTRKFDQLIIYAFDSKIKNLQTK
jgi:hypothetical protein